MSSRTIVYKGLFLVWQLRKFYPDLQDAEFASALALVHSRFSTNTTPSWKRAHPNRIILHNGEINTIRGNINRMLAREETMACADSGARKSPEPILSVVDTTASDSSMLDNTLEFLMYERYRTAKGSDAVLSRSRGAADKNHAPGKKRDMLPLLCFTMMEPWDGPAAIHLLRRRYRSALCLTATVCARRAICVTNDGYADFGLRGRRACRSRRNGSSVNPACSRGKCCWSIPRTGTVLEDRRTASTAMRREHPYGEWLDQELAAAG